ncbi:MAG: GNAT family N-acetyltransferase [Sphingomonas sp.]|nr:GNAT family N-acetyltransferase [Sphingomonas sp.]
MYRAGRIATLAETTQASVARFTPVPDSAELRAFVHDGIDPRLARDWAALAGQASEPNGFAEHWFVAASLATLRGGRDVRIVEVRRGGAMIGVMPIAIEHRYGRLRVRFLQNWCHHHSFLGTPLIRAGEETAFWTALLDLLDSADWVPGFLHLRGLVEDGPVHRGLIAARPGAATVHREARALLCSELSPAAYYEQAVRQKKRKEHRRLRARLAEQGALRAHILGDGRALHAWADAFLALERAGWKGRAGSALACAVDTEGFFRDALAGAWEAGRLQFLRLDLEGRPIAMLVNFLCAPGGFSFKTAFDEAYAHFSPGVLLQIENLGNLGRPDIAWMDSCAAENHPMIEGLWRERRVLARVTVPLKGTRRAATFRACRVIESSWALAKRAGR